MDDDDLVSWIYLDGPEPEPVREMLDLLRVLPPATAEDVARMERVYFARFSGAAGLGLGDPSDPLPLPFPLPLPDPDLGPREGDAGRAGTKQSRPAVTMEEVPPSLPARWMTMGGDPPTPPVPPVTMGGDFPKPAVPPPSALASTSLELDLRLPGSRAHDAVRAPAGPLAHATRHPDPAVPRLPASRHGGDRAPRR